MTLDMEGSTKVQNWHTFGAIFGLCGGLLCAVTGSLLTAASWLAREPQSKLLLHQLGGALLCLTIPLLLVGGFCMDWLSPAEPDSEWRSARAADEDDEG